ncbi:MAG: Crp/Fnr family transcriptional regulator [Bacteroidota bacterium]
MKKIKIAKKQILQRKGEFGTKGYLVESGLLRSYSIDQKGKEHIFTFATEGWVLADNSPPDVPSALFIDALEETVAVVFEKGEEKPSTQKLLNRLNVLQQRVIMLMSASALERYDHFVATYPGVVQRVPQRMIASYLGITPEALSKVKSERNRQNRTDKS